MFGNDFNCQLVLIHLLFNYRDSPQNCSLSSEESPSPTKIASSDLGIVFADKMLCDVDIIASDGKFKAHKIILMCK